MQALTRVAERLVTLGSLRPEVDTAFALDVLWFHFGPHAWTTLVGQRGWAFDRAQERTARTAEHALLRPRTPARSGGRRSLSVVAGQGAQEGVDGIPLRARPGRAHSPGAAGEPCGRVPGTAACPDAGEGYRAPREWRPS